MPRCERMPSLIWQHSSEPGHEGCRASSPITPGTSALFSLPALLLMMMPPPTRACLHSPRERASLAARAISVVSARNSLRSDAPSRSAIPRPGGGSAVSDPAFGDGHRFIHVHEHRPAGRCRARFRAQQQCSPRSGRRVLCRARERLCRHLRTGNLLMALVIPSRWITPICG
jgi:hypothetical protein